MRFKSFRVLARLTSAGHVAVLITFATLLAFAFAGCRRSEDKATGSTGTNTAAAAKAAGRTNPATALQPGAKTMSPPNQPPNVVRPFARTNIAVAPQPGAKPATPGAAAKAGTATNAVAGKSGGPVKAGGGFSEKFRGFLNSTAFYPVVVTGAIVLSFAGLFLYQYLTGKSQKGGSAGSTEVLAPAPVSRPVVKKKRGAPVTSCNVLHFAPESRHLWQFASRGRAFVLNREQATATGEALPPRVVTKDWTSLWQRKLNIAWLPAEQVFLRVAQLPASDFDETLSMVELQLEKLSPMPVAQIVWSIQVLRHAEGNLQTVIVMIVSRNVVEEFLGRLEGQGYLADRLELPRLDQLLATTPTGDGAWIYPETTGARSTALIAWWYGGVLQSLALINLSVKNGAESLKEQLLQLAWAGELEGWLTAPPSWHLVADTATATEWEPPLRAALEQPIEVIPALTLPELAARTATRAVQSEPQANLLPIEFSTRYQQVFVDRLWMRGVGAVILLYIVGVVIYFGRLQWENFKSDKLDQEVAHVGPIYTNAIELKTKYQILKDREDLKWAALDTWNAIAALLPENVTLEGYNLTDGKRLALNGTAPAGQEKRLIDFDSDLRKASKNNQPLFNQAEGDHIVWQQGANGTVNWRCTLELKQSEEL